MDMMDTSKPAAAVTLDALDLAALIASRVCHDVISPVGAINNGLEVLEEEKDEEMRTIAMELVKKSARQASAKLQFARIAFGAAGSAGAEIDSGEAEQVARGFVETDKVSLGWTMPRMYLPKNEVKLLLNLLMLAMNAIPRGGRVQVEMVGQGPERGYTVRSHGINARVPPHAQSLVNGIAPEGRVDAHAIQPFYTGLIAKAAGLDVLIALENDDVMFRATRMVAENASA